MFNHLRELCPVVAGKYKRLQGKKKEIADLGILRHYVNCRKAGCPIDISVIHEIINDARHERAIYAENDAEKAAPIYEWHNSSSLSHVHPIGLLNGLRRRG